LIAIAHRDPRGSFVKTFHRPWFVDHGMAADFVEEYFSVSKRGALRGLHFQTPPHDHTKLVYCVQGSIIDAVLDLRVGSPTYGQHALFSLTGEDGRVIYVPPGLAHGFYATSEQAIVVYNVTSVYDASADSGVLWSSAGIPWPTDTPILSVRDSGFPPLSEFSSPFEYRQA
jgi:dTDP-4-dehydrorhamnose 3,5-epimerase